VVCSTLGALSLAVPVLRLELLAGWDVKVGVVMFNEKTFVPDGFIAQTFGTGNIMGVYDKLNQRSDILNCVSINSYNSLIKVYSPREKNAPQNTWRIYRFFMNHSKNSVIFVIQKCNFQMYWPGRSYFDSIIVYMYSLSLIVGQVAGVFHLILNYKMDAARSGTARQYYMVKCQRLLSLGRGNHDPKNHQ